MWPVVIVFILLFSYLVYSILERQKETKGYYDKVSGFKIDFPNKNWSAYIPGVKRFADGMPYSEIILQYKEKPYSFSIILRKVGKIIRKKREFLEEEILDLLKEWRLNPRNLRGEYDNYDWFNLPLFGKDTESINCNSFKKIEYNSVKG